MKIAIASENEMVAQHFGHCANFNIFEVEDKKIIKQESVANPGHKPGFLPKFLNNLGVTVIISGGMGQGALDIFKANGITVITGAAGKNQEVVQSYLSGELVSNNVVCREHAHRHNCGKH